MTFKQLVSELCKREGGKRGVNVADMSEIVKCLKQILDENEPTPGYGFHWLQDNKSKLAIVTLKRMAKPKRRTKKGKRK